MAIEQPAEKHRGGGFNRPEPTTRGGPDYGRFVEAVRTLQDHARAVDAPDEVITEAAGLIEDVSKLLAPYYGDEWNSPSGRRMDLPNRGNILQVPFYLAKTDDGRIRGTATFRRYHLGRNGAVHGGRVAKIAEKHFDIAIVHEFRRRLPPNKNTNSISVLQQPAHEMAADQPHRAGDENSCLSSRSKLRLKFCFCGIRFLRNNVRPIDRGASLIDRHRHGCARLQRAIKSRDQ